MKTISIEFTKEELKELYMALNNRSVDIAERYDLIKKFENNDLNSYKDLYGYKLWRKVGELQSKVYDKEIELGE